jgi:hypothetical protein
MRNDEPGMQAILIHGMGRTPLSMLLLAARLRMAGMQPRFFTYCAALESWPKCTGRLEKFIRRIAVQGEYIVIGHSLGTVLARAVMPKLSTPPTACFLIAPPATACLAARRFAPLRLYRWLTGEMGQLLASQPFMDSLPTPHILTKIYAGTGGFRGRQAPFGACRNDGVLALHETRLTALPVLLVPAVHTFIMNKKAVAEDILQFLGYPPRQGCR